MTETKQSKPLILALGGGGSRAFVHLGVLDALAEAGLRIDGVAGSSMGAVLGALYAIQPDAATVKEKTLAYFTRSSLFGGAKKQTTDDGRGQRMSLVARMAKTVFTFGIVNNLVWRRSVQWSHPVHKAIDDLLPDKDVSSTQIPFAATALDLMAPALVTFTDGPLRPVLKASTAVGVVFKPYAWRDTEWIDAAPVSSVPVRAARNLDANAVVLAVDIRTPLQRWTKLQNGFDVISRIESIESSMLNNAETDEADAVIRPDVGDIFWGDFSRLPHAAAVGKQATLAQIDRIRALVG